MNTSAYTYCIVRYVHDPAAGEQLNIGVLLYAPTVPYIGALVEYRYERLSKAFAAFAGDHYRHVLAQFEAAIQRFNENYLLGLREMWDLPADAGAVARVIWPDVDLSFQVGTVLAGVTSDPARTVDAIFARMVTSQQDKPEMLRRSDDDVWAVYDRPLRNVSISKVLKPAKLTTPDIDLTFDHTFKNGTYRAMQPMSFDLMRAETMRDKATKWLGYSVALRDLRELDKIYVLLGRPRDESLLPGYTRAKNLLHKMEVDHEFVEEEDAQAFAIDLRTYLREHGILQDDLASTPA